MRTKAKSRAAKPMGTYTVPESAVAQWAKKDGKPTVLDVYAECGPLLVTRVQFEGTKGGDDMPYNLTVKACGLKFGKFTTLDGARKAAKALASYTDVWMDLAERPLNAPLYKNIVVPVVRTYGEM